MERKILAYMASPYSDPDPEVRLKRFHEACKAASELMQLGYLVFSPICHSHSIAVGWGLPLGFDYWEALDRRMIAACDEVVVLTIPGWQESKGIAAELKIAAELGKPVYSSDDVIVTRKPLV